jgi:anion-transporting  ArsA/GET3 family ATPase
MASLLSRKLIVVTGKGGTGKSTVAGALGLIAARRGLRTIVVEVGARQHMAELFAGSEPLADGQSDGSDAGRLGHARQLHRDHHDRDGDEVKLQEGLWSTTIDPERALIEWLHTLTGRISARLLASSNTFQYFAAAAPGAKELVSMVKVRELCEGRGAREGRDAGKEGPDVQKKGRGAREGTSSDAARDVRDRAGAYDLVVLDAPATGHALAMLGSPQTFSAIVRVGPLAEQAGRVRELLEDPQRSGYVAVTHATEMAVTETLELEQGLRRELDRDLDAVVVNGTVPRRFTREELGQIAALDMGQITELDVEQIAQRDADIQVVQSATRMARAAHERARVQQNQIARLRRQRLADGKPPSVITVPFAFVGELDLTAVRGIAERLEGKLAQ